MTELGCSDGKDGGDLSELAQVQVASVMQERESDALCGFSFRDHWVWEL